MLWRLHCYSPGHQKTPQLCRRKQFKKLALKEVYNYVSNRIFNHTSFNKHHQAHTRHETEDSQKNTDSWNKRLHHYVHTYGAKLKT